jgi:hypothetical protein
MSMPTTAKATTAKATTAKANKADKAGDADYEIHVTLSGEQVVPQIPSSLNRGETVHYNSDDGTGRDAGEVTIKFLDNGSPYRNLDGSPKLEISSKDPPLTLSEVGIFTGRCYITWKGKEYGWSPNYPAAGGNHDVR